MDILYPLKFEPVYKDYPWGNTILPERFGRSAPAGTYAESWEVSTHPDGASVIINGSLAGKPLAVALAENGLSILGSAVNGNDFPLLIKVLDAATPLSVQVHPHNDNAAEVQGEAKTEMWYFLNEEPAQVYCGLKPGTTRSAFLEAIKGEHLEEVLRIVPALKGGAAFVPGGRVHAIDAGCLIFEVQQNSNTTYRVYDWGRVDAAGQLRELHIEKALRVINFEDDSDPVCTPKDIAPGIRNICTAPYFVLDELRVNRAMELEADGHTFHVLFSADDSFELLYGNGEKEAVARGTSVLIPASLGRYTLTCDADLTVLKVSVPLNG